MEKMETHQAAGGSDEQQICKRNSVKYGKCKHVSGDNKLQYCDFHYIILTDFLTNTITSEEIEPPPDEDRCCQSNHTWRCKNFRMGHGDDDDSSVPKRRYCEKHYNYYVNKYRNLKSGDVKSKTRKKITGIQPPTENPSLMDMNLPPDEQRCCRRSRTWRCKNFSMGHVRVCQKHYNDRANYLLKLASGDRTEGAGSSATRYPNCSNKVTEENDVTGIQPPTSDTIVCGGSPNIGSGEVESLTGIRVSVGTKRKKVQRTEWSGELDFADFLIEKPSLITSNEMNKKKQMEKKKLPPDEQYCCVHTHKWRCKNVRMGYGAADDDASVPKTKFCEKHYNYYAEIQSRKRLLEKQTSGDGEAAAGPIKRKRITGERTEGSGEPDSMTKTREPMVEFLRMENYKRKRSELCVKLEKRKLECTKLPGILLGEVETRQTAAKVEPEEWNKCSDLESRVPRVELEISTKRCANSNLESLIQRNEKESPTLRCVGLPNFEEIESVAWGLQNEVTQAVEKHNTSIPNAESSIGGRKDSHVFELKTKENVHGIGINKHHESEFEFPNYSAADIYEDSDCSTDSESSLGTLMDLLAMKYMSRNEDKEIKWKFEADMLSSFEEEPELCMKAVCALYRHHISEISANALFHYSDACRCTTLAKFLMDGACGGELRKSVKELQIFDSKGVEDCKRLAASYSKQLFSIYQNGKDPFFLPATTASHGDKTAK